ncbi:hypothetical protein MBLNU457_g0624t2 [Dothideomycetes sp. NU457]
MEKDIVVFHRDLLKPYGFEFKKDLERDVLWLRDSCKCEACINQSSRQKQFETTDIPEDIKVKDMEIIEDMVHLTWENDVPGFAADHKTVFHLRDIPLMGNSKYDVRKTHRNHQMYWKKDLLEADLTVVDFDDYVNKEEALLSTLQALRKYGIAFVQNVPESGQSVVDIALRIGPLKNTFYGYTWDVRSVPDAKNVAYTHGHLGFHMDLLYMKQPPRLQFLHCVRSSAQGGASLFADSYRAVKDILNEDPKTLSAFSISTRFEYHNDGHHYSYSHPVVSISEKNRMRTNSASKSTGPTVINAVAYSPPFQGHQIYVSPEKLRKWYSVMKMLKTRTEQPDMIYQRQMKPGECVIFDNQRVLHARTAFVPGDAGKERWLRGAYLDEDPWLSKLRVLEDKYGAEPEPDSIAAR